MMVNGKHCPVLVRVPLAIVVSSSNSMCASIPSRIRFAFSNRDAIVSQFGNSIVLPLSVSRVTEGTTGIPVVLTSFFV